MKPNTPIYYYHRNGDTYPGVYLRRRLGKVKIRYNAQDTSGDKTVWTLPGRIVPQAATP